MPDNYLHDLRPYPENAIREYEKHPPEIQLTLTAGTLPITPIQGLRLWWQRWTKDPKFQENLRKGFILKAENLHANAESSE